MKTLFILVVAALLVSCGGKQKSEDEKPNVEEFAGIAKNMEGGEPSFKKALPTDGVYVGLLVDENGKLHADSTVIELKGKTFVLYKKNSEKESEKGLFQFGEDGAVLTLIGVEGLNKFGVDQNALFMLDKNGNKVGIDKAVNYSLVKKK